MNAMTLLPCPFCGGEPEIVRAQDEDGRFAAVGCPHCGAGSRQHYFVGDDAVPHVVSAWNRRAHLAHPAQAVDVEAIREVIKRLEEHPLSDEWKVFDQCADKLTRALSGEKAGPVDGWQPIETAPKDGEDILATDGTAMLVTYWYGASTGWLYRYTDHGVDGWSPTHWMPLPASPAPEKEVQP